MESFRHHDPDIHPASQADIPVLVSHHLKMFEEIWEKRGSLPEPGVMDRVSTEYARKLEAEMDTGACSAWVILQDGIVVSSGAISIVSYVPNPIDPSCRIALLHSIYTEKGYRNSGYASCITREAARFCRDQKIGRLYLFASADGRHVYEKAGFIQVDNLMMLPT